MARQAATSRIRKVAAVKVVPAKGTSTKASPSKGIPVARPSKAAAVKFDAMSAEQKVAHLLAERDALFARIDALEADLARRRTKQAQAADRVAWALDSLRDILGERA